MPIRVLFLQSQSYFGADSEIHSQLMRYFDREEFVVHVACNPEEQANQKTTAIRHLRTIPDLLLRETDFGPTRDGNTEFSRKRVLVRSLSIPGMLLSLAAYIRKHKIQIIHCTEKPRDVLYGILLARVTGAKCILHMHVNYGEWQSRIVKWGLNHADAIIGVSDFTSDSIAKAGYPKERIHTVLNSLALASSRWNTVLDGRPMRRAMGISDDTPVLGIVSRLFNWKGHLDLINALAIVREEFPNVRLIIVGEDDARANLGGGSFKEELKRRICELALEENVQFTGFRTDVPELMAAFDIYTMPSWEEPFGMVYVEAMAMKKPVVAWDIAGPSQIILDGETGFLVKPKDIPALAEAICKLIRDPALRVRFGEAGRKRVEEEFASSRMCRDVKAIYEKLLA